MQIDINKKYFLMSFRFDKSRPEDFGLKQSFNNENIFICNTDKSEWVKKELYDFGWGNENGFELLPQLEFEQLLYLLANAKIQENKYGAAHILESEYSDKLLIYLLELINKPDDQITENMKDTFKILKLGTAINRSNIVGKTYIQIKSDFENWRFISERVTTLLNKTT